MSTIITKRQFPHYHKYTMDLAGRPLTLEVGKLAELANAAVMVGYGDTRVLCCVTAAPPSPGRHRLLPPVRGLRGEDVRRGPHSRQLQPPRGPSR